MATERPLIERVGGPGRDRTDDLFHAMEARSQLRHRPLRMECSSILTHVPWLVKLGSPNDLTIVPGYAPTGSILRKL